MLNSNLNRSLLYKYRPKDIEDFNIDKFSKRLIDIYIKNNNFKLLFQGNICSGKSSIINVILNKYYDNDQNLINKNIMLINLLKEQGINFFRSDLKNFCQINNTQKSKIKKTVIFDDIDMVNEQCQKIISTLISNYENINFLITCNDLNKVYSNIINKVELININITNHEFLYSLLNKIIKENNVIFTEENKNALIKTANMSIPRLINNLDKLFILNNLLDNKLDNKILNIENIYSNILISEFDNYIKLCIEANYEKSIECILNFYDKGFSVIDILDELFIYIKNYLDLIEEKKYKIIKLICNYINIFNNLHEDKIELIFLTNNIINIFNPSK